MAKNSKIEWTDHTFNPWMGCTKVSPACDNCYASVSTPARTLKINWGAGEPRRRTSEANWREPLRWNADCESRGIRERVFCASLSDVFDNEVSAQWRVDLLELIAKTPNLDWLLLTKRIGNANKMLGEAMAKISHGLTEWGDPIWPNVWLGATICNQEEANRDIPKLLATPAAKRFLSIEPLLGPINLEASCDIAEQEICKGTWDTMADPQRCLKAIRHGSIRLLDWVIVGGESGPKARPMHPEWARSLRDQCAEVGVDFFFKQWGEFAPNNYNDGSSEHMDRMGKKLAGRLLDGVEFNQLPA